MLPCIICWSSRKNGAKTLKINDGLRLLRLTERMSFLAIEERIEVYEPAVQSGLLAILKGFYASRGRSFIVTMMKARSVRFFPIPNGAWR